LILRTKMCTGETKCESVKLDFVVDPTKRRPRRVRSMQMHDGLDHDHEIRMLLIGDSCSGKGAAMAQFCKSSPLRAGFADWLGFDFNIKFMLDEVTGETMKLVIWGPHGQGEW